MTQSIIIYRNPMEQMFWESNALIPVVASILVFVVVLTALMNLTTAFIIPELQKRYKGFDFIQLFTITNMAVAAVAAVCTFKGLYLG